MLNSKLLGKTTPASFNGLYVFLLLLIVPSGKILVSTLNSIEDVLTDDEKDWDNREAKCFEEFLVLTSMVSIFSAIIVTSKVRCEIVPSIPFFINDSCSFKPNQKSIESTMSAVMMGKNHGTCFFIFLSIQRYYLLNTVVNIIKIRANNEHCQHLIIKVLFTYK